MPVDSAGNWVPGPNDHHINADGRLESGLGADEPTQKMISRMRSNGEKRMEALRAEIAQASEQLETREQQLARREEELAAREEALAKKEAGKKSKPSEARPDSPNAE